MSSKRITFISLLLLLAAALACNFGRQPPVEDGQADTENAAATAVADIPQETASAPEAAATADPNLPLEEQVEAFIDLPKGHDDDLVYPPDSLPPPGGIHGSRWQNCGIYVAPINTGNALHSLEHGAVWVTYQSELSADEVAVLQGYARGQSYTILSPYPGLKSPVVLTGWGVQLELDSVTDERIVQFLERYQQGPQTPEPGAPCHGGVGQPIDTLPQG